MLALVALSASALATRFGSIRAGVLAGVIAISLPPTFQLLGLGHLMTLFGMWAATMALTLITLRFDHLQERATWWWATVALTICFLSYTASLLFAATVAALALPLLYPPSSGTHPRPGRRDPYRHRGRLLPLLRPLDLALFERVLASAVLGLDTPSRGFRHLESSRESTGQALLYIRERPATSGRPSRPRAGREVTSTDASLSLGRHPYPIQWS